MSTSYYWISTPQFTVRVGVRWGRIVEAAPIVSRWLFRAWDPTWRDLLRHGARIVRIT